MKKCVLLAFLFIGPCIFHACCKQEVICFSITSHTIDDYSWTAGTELPAGDSIDAVNYAIKLYHFTEQESCTFLQFEPTALYAGNCDIPIVELNNRVTEILISSNGALTSDLSTRSPLNAHFHPFGRRPNCEVNFGCETDYFSWTGIETLEDAFNEQMALNSWRNSTSPTSGFENYFRLIPPEYFQAGVYDFTIRFTFEDGTVMESTTDSVYLM